VERLNDGKGKFGDSVPFPADKPFWGNVLQNNKQVIHAGASTAKELKHFYTKFKAFPQNSEGQLSYCHSFNHCTSLLKMAF